MFLLRKICVLTQEIIWTPPDAKLRSSAYECSSTCPEREITLAGKVRIRNSFLTAGCSREKMRSACDAKKEAKGQGRRLRNYFPYSLKIENAHFFLRKLRSKTRVSTQMQIFPGNTFSSKPSVLLFEELFDLSEEPVSSIPKLRKAVQERFLRISWEQEDHNLVGWQTRWRPVLPRTAAPRRSAMRDAAMTRRWYVLVLGPTCESMALFRHADMNICIVGMKLLSLQVIIESGVFNLIQIHIIAWTEIRAETWKPKHKINKNSKQIPGTTKYVWKYNEHKST